MNADTLAMIRDGVCPECGGDLKHTTHWATKQIRWWCPVAHQERVFVEGVGYAWPEQALHRALTIWWEPMGDGGLVLVKGGKEPEEVAA